MNVHWMKLKRKKRDMKGTDIVLNPTAAMITDSLHAIQHILQAVIIHLLQRVQHKHDPQHHTAAVGMVLVLQGAAVHLHQSVIPLLQDSAGEAVIPQVNLPAVGLINRVHPLPPAAVIALIQAAVAVIAVAVQVWVEEAVTAAGQVDIADVYQALKL